MYTPRDIEGWMTEEELFWLFVTALKMRTVAEIGCYKGRSTHALLCSGADVTAVDHFHGTAGEQAHKAAAREDGIFRDFQRNVGHFPNLSIVRRYSLDAALMFADGAFDMVFIDSDHEYEAVKLDIMAWRPKAKYLLCGHDYHQESWPGVVQAVRELVGSFEVCGSIWYCWLDR
jgi:hypothetical protein